MSRVDEETKNNVRKWLKTKIRIKEFDNKGVAFDIRDDTVVIGLIKSNTTITIKDKAFIDLMKRVFEKVYAQSEEIKL